MAMAFRPLQTLSLLLLLLSRASASASAAAACASITAALGPSLVKTSGAEYNATATTLPWNLFNSVDRPTCIVYPEAARHVQSAMRAIFVAGSKYAVIAGGHCMRVCMRGYNSITDGVLISFQNMQNISYDAVSGLVTLQPGIHWGDAVNYLEGFGVTVMGGRAADVGTGLLLGGGISFLSPQYGWSSDALREVDLVLVDGRLVTATRSNQFKDLFEAVKGGANRFGIATRYVVESVQTGIRADKNWFGGMVVVSGKSCKVGVWDDTLQLPGIYNDIVNDAMAKFVRENTDPKAIVLLLQDGLAPAGPSANVLYLYYNGPSLPTSIYGPFLSLNATSVSFSALSYAEIAAAIPGNERGNGQGFGAASFIGSEATFHKGFNQVRNFTTTFGAQLASFNTIVSVVPRSQWVASTKRGPNAIGDPGKAYAVMNYYVVYPAGQTQQGTEVRAGVELLMEQLQYPENEGLPLYINECDASQAVYATYPAFEKLKRTYAKYDPTRFNIRNTPGPLGL
ncbi:FAD-binding protein [Mycena kentingensis (nom. inval.)]|nr:FAD-binding protein [Mycena kentingensis (nom. inval.)]